MKFGIFDLKSVNKLTKQQERILKFFEFMKRNNVLVDIDLWGCDACFEVSEFDKSSFEKEGGIYYGFFSRLVGENFEGDSAEVKEEIFNTMRKKL